MEDRTDHEIDLDDTTRPLAPPVTDWREVCAAFRTFREAFAADFETTCDVIGPPSQIAAHVLSHPPLSVALLTLHVEWMTQQHFLESARDDQTLDPVFKDLLLHHWMEEHQHSIQ